MSSERPEQSSNEAARQATVLVRGETIREPQPTPDDSAQPKDAAQAKDKQNPPPKAAAPDKVEMQGRLPVLADDADVGVEKGQRVIRDGKPDLIFTGTLLASAAPSSAPQGQWQEYRIYETSGGKHVFSKVSRNVIAEEQDTHEAEVFDPAPSSVPSKLLRSARDLTHTRPMTWTDAAAAFFGYDPLAKALYRKLSGQFEEHIA
jgi:hypothetical protein